MVRLVIYLLAIALIAAGLGWLADRPGTLQIAWQGYDIETSVFRAAVLLAGVIATAIFLWSILRAVWNSPARIGRRIVRKRQKRGLDALSGGLIAVGAGDAALAQRYALLARKALPHEPLTHLLRARAAELSGDRSTSRRIYEAMLAAPETEQLGLRGLYLEATREGAGEAAEQYAQRALSSNPRLGWSADALFDQQCKQRDWAGALETLELARRNGHLDKGEGDRKRAVLMTAQALALEDSDADKALGFAMQAHQSAPDLVPAAVVAGRILAGRGQTAKAAKVLQKTWVKAPHPDIATVYAHARVGDSTRDRLDRARQLAALSPHSIESPIAVATTAIDARLYDEARMALEPLLADRLTQRVATLMARIEAGENGAQGRVREWLARAVTAARDPVWMADGVISDHWEPVSPVTGVIDRFQWRVPVEARDASRAEIDANRLEELLAIEAPDDTVITAQAVTVPVAHAAVDEAVAVAPSEHGREGEPPEGKPSARNVAEPADEPVGAPLEPVERVAGQSVRSAESAARTKSAAPQAARQQAAPSGAKADRAEATVFVAPRAPDDPGPEGADLDLQPVARPSYRAL